MRLLSGRADALLARECLRPHLCHGIAHSNLSTYRCSASPSAAAANKQTRRRWLLDRFSSGQVLVCPPATYLFSTTNVLRLVAAPALHIWRANA